MGFRGTDDQRNLTPFQRQVLDAERGRRAEAKREQQEKMQRQAQGKQPPSRPKNSRAGGSGNNSHNETVRHINTSENPEYGEPE